MNHYAKYKKRNETEKKIFKYNDSDLNKILIKNKDLIDEFGSLTSSEIDEKIKNLDYNKISYLLLNNLNHDTINDELDKLDKYKIKSIVKENFPYKKPRELQLETISKIYDAIEKGYKYIILEAVSGFGKSLIAATLSNIYSEEKSYTLTTTNQLINQYIEDFKSNEITNLKPRSLFRCKKSGLYCNAYLCKYSKCDYYKYSDFSNDFEDYLSCNYLYELKEGLKSSSVICTYDYFIKENFYHRNFKKRKLLICDESHNLDEKISNVISLTITDKQLRGEMGLDPKKEHEHISQNGDYYYYLLRFKKIYESQTNRKKKGSHKYIKLKKTLDDITKFMSYFDKNNENIVFKRDENENWIFKPIKVNKLMKDSLLNTGETCIFMSSSIFDYENFAYDLGINRDEIFTLRVPNIFDLSKNPIEIFSNFEMSGENINKGIAKTALDTIKQILDSHVSEKGVIHTTNREFTTYITENIDNDRLITHDQKNREYVLDHFKNSKQPLVLVSPSMNEGVDLPGELCRFQILFKLPYLPYEDSWINKRKEIFEDGKEWYRYKMLTKLIQTYGRGIRFEGDYCRTYILDNRLFDVINEDMEENKIIPQYFIHAIENFNLDS